MSNSNNIPESWLPLKTPVLFILLALADGHKHGYAIMQETKETSAGQVRLGPGTLYGNLQRLIEQGLIQETATQPEGEGNDERRRYYELTGLGRRVISAEVARLENLVRTARAKALIPSLS